MEKIIINGKALLETGEFAEAIAIDNGYIKAVGTTAEVLKLKSEQTRIIDVDGKLVLPGFNDSHLHLYNLGSFLSSLNLYGLTSIEAIIDAGKKYISTHNLGHNQTVIGRGWNQDYFTDEKRILNRHDLDKISTDFPIYFKRACGHVTVCNTKALELVGITAKTPQVLGGVFEIGTDGLPNGVFNENAQNLIEELEPEVALEMVKDYIKLGAKHALENGITSVQTNDFTYGRPEHPFIIQAYQELIDSKELPLRICLQCCFDEPSSFMDFINQGYHTGYGTKQFKIGPLKLFADGSLGARTALMRSDYHDEPNNKGVACLTFEQLNEMITLANDNKFQVIVHAIGDEAISRVLTCYEGIYDPESNNPLRHGINHCQITDTSMLERFKDTDTIAYVQPIFLHYDLHIVEDRVGNELAQTSYGFRTMEDLGIKTAYGTDAPVEDLSPFECMYCAITRKDLSGYPKKGFYPNEVVSIDAAINRYTMGSAYASFEEDIKGTIAVGKLADLVVIDKDLFTIDVDEVKNVKVALTMIGGEIVYQEDSR